MDALEMGVRALRGKEREFTPDNAEAKRQEIATMRETFPFSMILLPVTLNLISKYAREAVIYREYNHAANFYLEQVLLGDQLVKLTTGRLDYGKRLIKDGLQRAQKIIEDFPEASGIKETAARFGLFAAKQLFVAGEYQQAIPILEKAIGEIQGTGLKENAIELEGFLAEALIRTGDLNGGIALGLSAFAKYDTDPDVLKMRGTEDRLGYDYNKWISWRAGCAVRVTEAILDTTDPTEIEKLSPGSLEKLTGNIETANVLGTDKKVESFGYRNAQLKKVWARLRRKGIVSGELKSADETKTG